MLIVEANEDSDRKAVVTFLDGKGFAPADIVGVNVVFAKKGYTRPDMVRAIKPFLEARP
jgi:hypothetical protein